MNAVHARRAIPLALAALFLLPPAACQDVPRTEVLVEIGYDTETTFDGLVLTAYLYQDTSQDASYIVARDEVVTLPRPSVLVTVPEAWEDQKVYFEVRASRDGSVVASAGESVLAVRHQRTDLLLILEAGEPVCNDGHLQPGEACDGTDVPADACERELALAGEASCKNCRLDLSDCSICGNASIEGREACDGNDFGLIASCQDAGFASGTLGCNADCTLDTSACFGGCGDGVVQGNEACDRNDLQGATCATATGGTRPEGELRCDAACGFDTSACSLCGNGLLEGGEACEGGAFRGLDCGSYGFGPGALRCTSACVIDTSGCCGDGVKGFGEECDGSDVGAQTCLTRTGMPDGALACTAGCTLDVSGCHRCGNGAIEGPEQCDGNDLGGATCASLGQPASPDLACAGDCTYDISGCDTCGDGTQDAWEVCDDGNTLDGDGCSADCQSDETCGNGITDTPVGETCDDGVLNGTYNHCNAACDGPGPRCGDAVIQAGAGEQCDGANLGGVTCTAYGYVNPAGLACSSGCVIDLAGCAAVCGNGTVEPGETCDEGAANGTYGHCLADCSGLGPRCGDSQVQAGDGEQCDGANLGGADCTTLGYASAPGLACTGACLFDDAGCTASCGNGVVEPGEACDDGNLAANDGCSAACTVEAAWSCDGSPSACTPDSCGDTLIDQYEVCDGANLLGETCLSRGYRQGGGGGLACLPTCRGYDVSGCTGGPIDSVAQVNGAIADAHASAALQRIAIQPGTYNLTSSIVLDECSGACTGGRPFGVVLEALDDAVVCFTATGTFPVIDVVTGQNQLVNLCFQDVSQAVRLNAGADAGGNTLLRNRITNVSTLPDVLVSVESSGNALLANRFTSTTTQRGVAAVNVTAEGNSVVMNSVVGPFNWALTMQSFATATAVSRMDHNSIWVQGSLGGGGIRLQTASKMCACNNIVAGDGSSTGLTLASVTLGSGTDCGGCRAQQNVNTGHATACSGSSCASLCTGVAGTGEFCYPDQSPGWASGELCLSPGTNPLIDAAVIAAGAAYDHDDGSAAFYIGTGPDVGARESGTTRIFGGVPSACP